jgi:hypothetical protein
MKTASFIVKNLLVPVVTLVLSYMVYSLDQWVKTFDRQLREIEAARLEVSDDRETRFKIYDAVTKSLESTDVRRQHASPGYHISGLIIRREIGEEASAAALKQVADQAYKPRGEFTVMSSRQSTPGYLSMFVCQAG